MKNLWKKERQLKITLIILLVVLIMSLTGLYVCNKGDKVIEPQNTVKEMDSLLPNKPTPVARELADPNANVELTIKMQQYLSEMVNESFERTILENKYKDFVRSNKEKIEEDIEYLTRFLYGECRGSEEKVQSACAWVILNALSKDKPGNLKNTVNYYTKKGKTYTAFGYYWSNYLTSYGNYCWETEYNKKGKVKYYAVSEYDPFVWSNCKRIATNVYEGWMKEIAGYSEEEVNRIIPKNYVHFWSEKGVIYFPLKWGNKEYRRQHLNDFDI